MEVLDSNTDVLHSCYGSRGGLVSPREFVDVRRWSKRGAGGQSFLLAYRGVVRYPGVPEARGVVRGRNGTCGLLFAPVVVPPRPAHTPSCHITMLAQSQPGGWLPRSLAARTTISALLEFPARLAAHVAGVVATTPVGTTHTAPA